MLSCKLKGVLYEYIICISYKNFRFHQKSDHCWISTFTFVNIQISGADITVYDPPPETSDGSTIVISGTPDQAQSALAALIDLTKKMA
jgi:hypothetical protein